jgi:hypothetical protein
MGLGRVVPPLGGHCLDQTINWIVRGALNRVSWVADTFTLNKLECLKQVHRAWRSQLGIMDFFTGNISEEILYRRWGKEGDHRCVFIACFFSYIKVMWFPRCSHIQSVIGKYIEVLWGLFSRLMDSFYFPKGGVRKRISWYDLKNGYQLNFQKNAFFDWNWGPTLKLKTNRNYSVPSLLTLNFDFITFFKKDGSNTKFEFEWAICSNNFKILA